MNSSTTNTDTSSWHDPEAEAWAEIAREQADADSRAWMPPAIDPDSWQASAWHTNGH